MSARIDPALVEQARAGDAASRDELVRLAAQFLYPLAQRVVRDRDLADDAVQRTLVAIWRELPKLRQADRFEAWAHRTLVRFCLDELKRHKRGTSLEPQAERLGATDDRLELGRRDQLERAFGRLSVHHRAVVVMVYYQGLSGAEVAARLGVSPGTVASRLHYALRTLRAELEADERALPARSESTMALLPAASR